MSMSNEAICPVTLTESEYSATVERVSKKLDDYLKLPKNRRKLTNQEEYEKILDDLLKKEYLLHTLALKYFKKSA